MRYSITYPEDLRSLCIRENWFTCGSSEQYEKMFQMNAEGSLLTDIAVAIWICSDDVSMFDINVKLHEEKMKYEATQFGKMEENRDDYE